MCEKNKFLLYWLIVFWEKNNDFTSLLLLTHFCLLLELSLLFSLSLLTPLHIGICWFILWIIWVITYSPSPDEFHIRQIWTSQITTRIIDISFFSSENIREYYTEKKYLNIVSLLNISFFQFLYRYPCTYAFLKQKEKLFPQRSINPLWKPPIPQNHCYRHTVLLDKHRDQCSNQHPCHVTFCLLYQMITNQKKYSRRFWFCVSVFTVCLFLRNILTSFPPLKTRKKHLSKLEGCNIANK